MFGYETSASLDIRVGEVEHRGSITVSDVIFGGPVEGRRIAAYLVSPEGRGPFAGVLFAHWYEPAADNSNRTQFLDEAAMLAEHGVVSLLVETFWSRLDWFGSRDRLKDDYPITLRQAIEFRRALDVLLAQPGVHSERVAFAGHDFGGMFGAILAGIDRRPRSYVIMAATPHFSDWYLLGPPLPEDVRAKYVEELSALDPIRHIA